MYSNDRDQLRQGWVNAWRKRNQPEQCSPLELQIIGIIQEHPEYHPLLETGQTSGEYLPEMGETNPFLHMGMHLALREQVATNRPPGIAHIHRQLTLKHGSAHEAEHRMMDCLAEALWQAQRTGQMPDEQAYLTCLENLLEKKT